MHTPPLLPVLARSAKALPRPDALPGGAQYEAKVDGFRCLVFTGAGGVFLQSRNGSLALTRAFPELTDTAAALSDEEAVLDGELVVQVEGRLGRCPAAGRRSTPLPARLRTELSALLSEAGPGHPWHGVWFSAGWGTREALDFTCVQPDVVGEFEGDTAVDRGRWRHPVRLTRLRLDRTPESVPNYRTDQ